MQASTKIRKLTSRYRGSLAAASAIGAIVAGIIGGWLTNHWLWGVFCLLLILLVFVAAAEALKTHREEIDSNQLVINSPTLAGPYTSLNYTGNSYHLGRRASVGKIMLAGGNIEYHGHTINIKIGTFLGIILLALIGAIGGTFYMTRNPGSGALQNPATLAAEGGHESPSAAVRGFFGNAFQNKWAKACSYEPPAEQKACTAGSIATMPEDGSFSVGNAIVRGTRASSR